MRSTKPFDTNMALLIAAVGFVSLAIGQQYSEPTAPVAVAQAMPIEHAGVPVKHEVQEAVGTSVAQDHLRKDRDAALERSTDREPRLSTGEE